MPRPPWGGPFRPASLAAANEGPMAYGPSPPPCQDFGAPASPPPAIAAVGVRGAAVEAPH
eukprot:81066-Chlamydomonas_euryale.AAC.1